MPTVAQRAGELALTLAQWARWGVTPLVVTQPEDWPLNQASQRRNAERALRAALDTRPAATHVLFCEDDVDLAPDVPTWLPALMRLDGPTTFFLVGNFYYPPHIQQQIAERAPLDECVVIVPRLHHWWGTQAVLLARELVEELLCWESGRTGWDIHLQHYLRAHDVPLYATVPNLAQQRDVRTVMSVLGSHHRSLTFGRPTNGAGTTPGGNREQGTGNSGLVGR
jgi:hypothetical protein